MENLLGDSNSRWGGENIFKPMSGNESLQHDRNDKGVRIVNLDISKSRYKCTMFPFRTFIIIPGPY
jgi:hypothetical protein